MTVKGTREHILGLSDTSGEGVYETFQISISSPSIIYLRFLYYFYIFLEIKRGR